MQNNPSSGLSARAQSGDPGAQEKLGLELLANSVPHTAQFDEALGWLDRAATHGLVSAQLAAGQVRMQHPMLPGAGAKALDFFKAAATQGDPQAVERLADLHMLGFGVTRDFAKARDLYRQLADYAFPQLLCQLAYFESSGLGGPVDQESATTRILRAAAQGHTLAFALAGIRYLRGYGVPANGTIGAAWWALAAARKHPGAEHHHRVARENLPTGSQVESDDLAESLKNNLRGLGARLAGLGIAESDPDYLGAFHASVLENFAALGMDELSLDTQVRGRGDRAAWPEPEPIEVIAWEPRVFRIRSFLGEEEMAHLVDAAQPMLKSTEESARAGTAVEVDAFDGECAIFPPYLTSPVMRNVISRFSRTVQIDAHHFEPLSALRYKPGTEYTPHLDCFDGPRMEHYRAIGDLGGQRLATCLACLIKPDAGGETRYLKAGVEIGMEPGDALIHYNSLPDGTADHNSLHEGVRIERGEKWLVRTAVREASLYGQRYRAL